MAAFEVAHIREQGVNLIIVFVGSQFGRKGAAEQNRIKLSLQRCAASAGLAGTVVPVWDAGFGRMGFLAPPNWHSFFRNLSLADIAMNVNKKLTCG